MVDVELMSCKEKVVRRKRKEKKKKKTAFAKRGLRKFKSTPSCREPIITKNHVDFGYRTSER